MSEARIIAVAGATGAQGGGLVRAICDDDSGRFVARALTRDPDSDAARGLADLGAEVVACDLDDPPSVEAAFEGAWGAYCVTFYWAHFSPEKELEQARTMAEATRKGKLEHIIRSTLEDTRRWVPLADDRMPTLMDNYKVPHFDAKGEADHVFTELGVPTTFLLTSFYWDNLIHFGSGPQRGEDGVLLFTLPMGDAKLPGIASEDIGKCAYGIFRRSPMDIGETVGIAGGHPTGEEMAAALTEALGEEVRYNPVQPEVYRGFDFPGADDLGNMFQFKADFNDYYCGARSLEVSRDLNPELMSFERWLQESKDQIPID